MSEPTLPTLPADEINPATIDLGYRTRLPDEDDATDLEAPLALYEDEEEADSVIVPARHEEATVGEDRIRAWREIAEERHQTRKAEAAQRELRGQERRRKLAIAAAVLGVVGTLGAAATLLPASPTPAEDPAADMEGAVFAAPAVAIVIPADLLAAAEETLAAQAAQAPVEAVIPTAIPASPAPAAVPPPPKATAVQPAPSSAATGAFDPQVIAGTLNTWTADDTAWLQFDFLGTEPVEIHWLDAAGQQALNPWSCDGYLNRTTRRCYVGRTHERLAVALGDGAAPGTWTIQACAPGTLLCGTVTTIQVAAPLGG